MKTTNHQSLISNHKSRGAVILALGSPHYGRMAANAAASIRFTDKATPIHLVYSGDSLSHLTLAHKALFTSMAECPPEYYTKNGKVNYIKAKTCIYELSPFKETLMLDADLLWFGSTPVGCLMKELSTVDFTMQCRGVYDYTSGKNEGGYTHWCNVTEAQKVYKLNNKIYQLSSELLWFRKTKQTRKLFKMVREVFDHPKINTDKFIGDVPDEFAYNIATAKLGMYPRKNKEVFIYWPYLDHQTGGNWSEILNNYYGYSMGGNSVQPPALLKYEQMAKAHANALGLPYHFKLFPKKRWDKARATI